MSFYLNLLLEAKHITHTENVENKIINLIDLTIHQHAVCDIKNIICY